MAALADKVLRDKGYDFSIREDQMRVKTSILESKDTFALFPTGFGKNLTYVLPLFILNKVLLNKYKFIFTQEKNLY